MKATLTLNGKSIEVEVTEEEAKKIIGEKKDSGRVANGERYFYIYGDGDIDFTVERGSKCDNGRYELDNYFRTEEECKHKLARQKAIVKVNRRIAELNDGWEPNYSAQFKYHVIHYHHDLNMFEWITLYSSQHVTVIKHMKSDDIAQQIIQEFPEELKLIFNVK